MTESALTDLSASRIGLTVKCGLAFKFQYIDKVPMRERGAAMIFGSVIHDGVQEWYGTGLTTPENKDRHKEIDLVDMVRQQWPLQLPPKLWEKTLEMVQLDREKEAVSAMIQMQRPELKNPMGTKAFQASHANKDFIEAELELNDLCEASDIGFPKNENSFKMYKTSELVAANTQKEWKEQPRPLAVEIPFMIDIDGYTIKGRIDQVRKDVNLLTGEPLPVICLDMKTGRQPLTSMEAFIQAYLYIEAIQQMPELPNTDRMWFFLNRIIEDGYVKKQKGRIDLEKHRKLALRVLKSTVNRINNEDYAPSYGHWCKMCNFKDLCEGEIDIWEDDNTGQAFTS